MVSAHFALVLLGLVCLLFAALDMTHRRFNFIAAGLFFWLLSTLVTAR